LNCKKKREGTGKGNEEENLGDNGPIGADERDREKMGGKEKNNIFIMAHLGVYFYLG